MRFFLLAAVFIVSVASLAMEDVTKGEVKKTRKHHKKHHGKHHGKHHHHHHHHGKHHKKAGGAVTHSAEDAHAKAAYNPPHEATPTSKDTKHTAGDVWNRLYDKGAAHNPLNAHGAINVVAKEKLEKGKIVKSVSKVAKVKENEEDSIVKKMKVLEEKLQKKKVEKQGQIFVNGPLPADFHKLFSDSVAEAVGADAHAVKVTQTKPAEGGIVAVTFVAPPHVVNAVEQEVSDPDSKLANGKLHSFLVSKSDAEDDAEEKKEEKTPEPKAAAEEEQATPVEEKGIDIDTAMPYGDLEPFGREDTAQELTEDSIKESDDMVDQLERAEVAEEKRAVFRALTRLRGAAITSFDGVARSQTGNIDEYNKIHKWRETHPLHHLADEESDISKWAFPDNADF